MRAVFATLLVAALMLAAPVAGQAYNYGGPSQATIETAERIAKEGAEQAAREKQEHEAKEKQEREARENPPAAQPPPQEQPQEPEPGSEASTAPVVVRCIVPSLRGDSLGAARNALHRAHCKLGKVGMPHARHGTLVVTGQSHAAGRKLARGAAVAVTLGPVKTGRG